MAKPGKTIAAKAVMMVGIAVIAGSIVGGIALAADLGRAADSTESTVPVGDDAGSEAPASTAPPPTQTTPQAPPETQIQTPPQTQPRTPSRTQTQTTPTPTCWDGPGSHPEGIEDCEDK